jgi:hypothetical protein
LGTVGQIPLLEYLLTVKEARSAHEAALGAVGPRLPIGDLELQDVLTLAANARRAVGRGAGGQRLAPARLRYEERDDLEEFVVLKVAQDRVLILQPLLAGGPVVTELEVVRGEGGG